MYSFDSIGMIVSGLIVGIIFGFLLQRGGVTRYRVIVGQFLLKDFTVLKVMLTAIIVGGVGIWGMLQLGMLAPTDLHVKNALLLGNIVGGLIFGVGMALLGYCPGTGVAAVADGSRHAIVGVLGMIVGAGVFAELYPWIEGNLLQTWEVSVEGTSKVTLPTLAGASPWWFVIGLAVVAAIVFLLLERWERRRGAAVSGA